MTKILISLITIAGLIYLISRDTWHMILDTPNYQISVSFVLFLTSLLLLWWFFSLLHKPIAWWHRFKSWRKEKIQIKREEFLPNLLTAFLAHDNTQTSILIKKAEELYGKTSREMMLVSALLTSQTSAFQALNQQETTKMAGLYGLIQQANAQGDFEEMQNLLKQVPRAQEKTPWVQQTKMQLALQHRDWKQALTLLEEGKKNFSKEIYRSHKACLLLKMGQLKEAYHLMPEHPAVALAYAKVAPKKAQQILEKAWHAAPCWQIYLAYKNTIKSLSENKRLKAILNLTRSTRDQRYSLLARADTDADLHHWARAKENLEIYLQNYPLTRQVADMMAYIERTGWHHEEIANEWERKAIESEDDSLWRCSACNHTVGEWQILCPHCNAFDSLYNQ